MPNGSGPEKKGKKTTLPTAALIAFARDRVNRVGRGPVVQGRGTRRHASALLLTVPPYRLADHQRRGGLQSNSAQTNLERAPLGGKS